MSGTLPERLVLTALTRPRRNLVVLFVLAVLAGLALTRLQTDFSPDKLFSGIAGQEAIKKTFRADFGDPDNKLVVVVQAEDVLAAPAVDYLHSLTESLAKEPYAQNTVSVTTLPSLSPLPAPGTSLDSTFDDLIAGRITVTRRSGNLDIDDRKHIRAQVAVLPLVRGTLVSNNSRLALIVVALDDSIDTDPEVAPAVAAVERMISHPPAGITVRLTGVPYLAVDIARRVKHDQTTLFPAAMAAVFALLVLLFRWLAALVLPLVAVALSALYTVAGIAAIGVPLDIINNIVPVLIIIVGVTDSIHFLHRYREELNAGRAQEDAVRHAMRAMVVALFLTSATTAAGFAALGTSELTVLRNFGFIAAAGLLCAYGVTVVFVPSALSHMRRPHTHRAGETAAWPERALRRLTRGLIRLRWVVLAMALLLGIGGAVIAWKTEADSRMADQYDVDDPAYATLKTLSEHVRGVGAIEILLTGPAGVFNKPEILDATDRAATALRAEPGVTDVMGHAEVLRQTHSVLVGTHLRGTFAETPNIARLITLAAMAEPSTSKFQSADASAARLAVSTRELSDNEIIALTRRMRDTLENALSTAGVTVHFTGESYRSALGSGRVVQDLLSSLSLAVFVIFGFIMLLLRSVRLGLLSIPPNVLPLLGTLAYMHFRGISLNIATVIIFSISIGLAVDGTIHVMARFSEEIRAGARRDDAITAAVCGTGRAVLVSYMSLIGGFMIFQLSSFVPIRHFGELISVTVACCMASTLVVLPPLLRVGWPNRGA